MTTTTTQHCTPFTLPSHGIIALNPTSTLTLTTNVLFTPECSNPPDATSAFDESHGISTISNVKDPFYASVTPQAYATGAATVIAWMLVFMLMITPRTFFIGGASDGYGLLGRRGVISGAQGGSSVIGVGSRPWLQKVAALTVAIGMTIITADTFRCAERQYLTGFMNAEALRAEVVGSTEIKVSRIISDIFLWLAMVQTLIRLFPRHKEKVLIKWIGFALIILDATFSSLNSFMGNPVGRPKQFRDAIPTLSYLFQLALSMLYATWVLYYAIIKRRFSFYHSCMWNISLVALLSFIALITPVVFFVTDISNANIASWGDYFRWVGMAAASVIVWEWVERIEALEREEKKDGILGREIFDGDEMLEVTAMDEIYWPARRRNWFKNGLNRRRGAGFDDSEGGGAFSSGVQEKETEKPSQSANHLSPPPNPTRSPSLGRSISEPRRPSHESVVSSDDTSGVSSFVPIATPPPAAVSPVSRTDTSSPGSTVYTIRYHTLNAPTTPQARPPSAGPVRPQQRRRSSLLHQSSTPAHDDTVLPVAEPPADDTASSSFASHIPNPFKRRPALPPAEVMNRGRVIDPVPIPSTTRSTTPAHNYSKWNIKGRIGAFAAEHGERFIERHAAKKTEEKDLPVTIIPAQPRGGGGSTWGPEVLVSPPATSSGSRSRGEAEGEDGRSDSIESGLDTPAPSVIVGAQQSASAASPGEERRLVIPAPSRTPSAGSNISPAKANSQ